MTSKRTNKSPIKNFIHRILYGSRPEQSERYYIPKKPTEEELYEYQRQLEEQKMAEALNRGYSVNHSKNSLSNRQGQGFKNEMEEWLNQPIFGLDAKKDLNVSLLRDDVNVDNQTPSFKSQEKIINYEALTKVENDIQQIKSMIEGISNQNHLKSGAIIDMNQQLSLSIIEQLKNFDFSKEFQEQWQEYLINNSQDNYEISLKKLHEFVQHEVRRLVYLGCDTTPKVHVFVGPPGVGKTTTIAKIASNEILQYQRKVGLITVDTYRIGAIEQLKTYASILNVPIKVVHNAEELKQALVELEDCDRIIVDSMGRTHRDYNNLKELKELLSVLDRYTCYLVLSMSTKYRELIRIMTEFQFLNYNHLILTKLDECERNENILNIFYQFQYPVAYLCTGQEVPTDIEIPTFKRILELIWGDMHE